MSSTHSEKYLLFTKDEKLTYNTLPSLIVACGKMPNPDLIEIVENVLQKNHDIEKELESDTIIEQNDFLEILEQCSPFRAADELLKHILFFTDNQMFISKEQFEKLVNIKGPNDQFGLTRTDLDSLYQILNVQDDKVNLEEFVHCIVDE